LPKQKSGLRARQYCLGTSSESCIVALGISRSHVLAKKHRASDWADRRQSPPRSHDTQVKQAIVYVVHQRATYCYRRVGVLKSVRSSTEKVPLNLIEVTLKQGSLSKERRQISTACRSQPADLP
jgi:hypothetical protein